MGVLAAMRSHLGLPRRADSLLRSLDQAIAQQASRPLARSELLGLRYFWLDGLFSAISENFYASFLTLFALAYGASNGQIGLLSSVGSLLGALAFFPGARLAEALGARKTIILWTGGGIGRLALLALAALPLFVSDPALALILIIVLGGLRAFMGNFGNPAWTALVADLVPSSLRGRYFGNRNMAMGVAALVVAPLAGWLIRATNAWTGSRLVGYQIVFILAFAFGLMGTICFARIPDPDLASRARGRHSLADLRRALVNSPGFLGMVLSAFVWNLAIQVAAPFFSVYMVNDLGGTASTIGLMASISSLFSLAGQRVFGPLLDRKGALWVQKVTGLLIPLLPLLWIFITRPWHAFFINAYGGFLWAGYNLANFNLLLELTPDEERPQAAALYQTVVFVSAVIGPLLGGYLADAVSFHLIFALSGIGRAAGIVLFLWLTARPAYRSGKGLPVSTTL